MFRFLVLLVLVALAACVLATHEPGHTESGGGASGGVRYGAGAGSVSSEGGHGREAGYGDAFGHETHGKQ